MSHWPFSYPWVLPIAGSLALLALGLGIWAWMRPGQSLRVVGQRPALLGLGLALVLTGLGLGLAEPRYGLPEVPRLEVHVMLDASRSMLAADCAGQSRWNVALATLDRLWSQPSPGLHYSLDLLTGDAIPLLPPGEDHRLLRDALRAIQPGEIGSPGTSMGRGIQQVVAQIDRKTPAVLLLIGDGEETWQSAADALELAGRSLKENKLQLYAMPVGGGTPQLVPGAGAVGSDGQEPAFTSAHPEFLQALAEASGGKLLGIQDNPRDSFQRIASGAGTLPHTRSLQPSHPEWGAWIALLGLCCWLLAAGKPLRFWRPVLMFLALAAMPASAQPLPQSVKAWIAQTALENGNLETAQKYRPDGHRPLHRLLSAQIDLKGQHYQEALKTLTPLTGQGAPKPLPSWRAPALLMAARAHWALDQPDKAIELLERLLKESPGQPEAVHNLQSLLKDTTPPPPKKPPPPPPRPSQGARQDELEGIKQRLPQKPPPKGVKDL